MAEQSTSTWYFPCEQTTLYPCGWFYELIAWKVRTGCLHPVLGEHLARYLVWAVSYFQHNLLRLAVVAGRMLRALCPRSFFSYSMQEPVITIALLWFFTCNSTSLPIAKWLKRKPELKATSPVGWPAIYEVPRMRATKSKMYRKMERWQDGGRSEEKQRNQEKQARM